MRNILGGRPRGRAAWAALATGALLNFGGGAVAAAAPNAMDEAFRTSAAGVQQSLAAGDSGGALQRARSLAGAADQPLEKYAAGQLMLQAAAGLNDIQAQRIALNVIFESGAMPEARAGEMRALAGILSAMLGEYKDTVSQVEYANRLGYASVPSQIALADAAFQTGNPDAGSAALEQAISLRGKAGQPVDTAWYDRAIALSYKHKRPDLLARWTQRKLAVRNGPGDWRSGLVNYLEGVPTGPEQSLDLYRLMAVTDALASERDWQAYARLAAAQGNFAEARDVLDHAIKIGDIAAGDAGVKKELASLRPKASRQLTDIAKGGATGNAAHVLAAADAAFGAGKFADAAGHYRAALEKGATDKERAGVRLGIALARSGDLAGGKARLAEVTQGPWAPVAGFWSVWIDQQMVRAGS